MKKKTCKECYFGKQCARKNICKYFTPISEEIEEDEVEAKIEKERLKYRKEWFTYTKEYDF
ncbi:MAG: hypothetical protein IKY16_06440 [Bacteroidales bacterium]|nr:hypothetical protein [Bacteroidales bacterium]